jgi:hypothetical protein
MFRAGSTFRRTTRPDGIGQAWCRLCRKFGVKGRLHDLRHLRPSRLLDAGEAITTVAAPLGHRDTSTTLKVYGHLMPAPTPAPPASSARRSPPSNRASTRVRRRPSDRPEPLGGHTLHGGLPEPQQRIDHHRRHQASGMEPPDFTLVRADRTRPS